MTRARIFYARVDEFWRKEEKYAYLDEKKMNDTSAPDRNQESETRWKGY